MSRQRSVTGFLLITFGGAWAVWGIAWLLGVFASGAANPGAQAVVAVGAFAPAIAAYITRRWIAREGFRDAGLRPRLRTAWPYYLLAGLLPFLVVAVIAALAVALKLSFVHTDLPMALIPTTLIGALILTPITFGEEFGWRGYLQVRVFDKSPLLAAVATGLAWGIFHYPVILLGFEGYENALLGLLVFPVFTVLLSVLLGWLRQSTDSIWPGCLAHAAANTVGGGLTSYLFFGGGQFALTSYAGVLAWLPLACVCLLVISASRVRGASPLAARRPGRP